MSAAQENIVASEGSQPAQESEVLEQDFVLSSQILAECQNNDNVVAEVIEDLIKQVEDLVRESETQTSAAAPQTNDQMICPLNTEIKIKQSIRNLNKVLKKLQRVLSQQKSQLVNLENACDKKIKQSNQFYQLFIPLFIPLDQTQENETASETRKNVVAPKESQPAQASQVLEQNAIKKENATSVSSHQVSVLRRTLQKSNKATILREISKLFFNVFLNDRVKRFIFNDISKRSIRMNLRLAKDISFDAIIRSHVLKVFTSGKLSEIQFKAFMSGKLSETQFYNLAKLILNSVVSENQTSVQENIIAPKESRQSGWGEKFSIGTTSFNKDNNFITIEKGYYRERITQLDKIITPLNPMIKSLDHIVQFITGQEAGNRYRNNEDKALNRVESYINSIIEQIKNSMEDISGQPENSDLEKKMKRLVHLIGKINQWLEPISDGYGLKLNESDPPAPDQDRMTQTFLWHTVEAQINQKIRKMGCNDTTKNENKPICNQDQLGVSLKEQLEKACLERNLSGVSEMINQADPDAIRFALSAIINKNHKDSITNRIIILLLVKRAKELFRQKALLEGVEGSTKTGLPCHYSSIICLMNHSINIHASQSNIHPEAIELVVALLHDQIKPDMIPKLLSLAIANRDSQVLNNLIDQLMGNIKTHTQKKIVYKHAMLAAIATCLQQVIKNNHSRIDIVEVLANQLIAMGGDNGYQWKWERTILETIQASLQLTIKSNKGEANNQEKIIKLLMNKLTNDIYSKLIHKQQDAQEILQNVLHTMPNRKDNIEIAQFLFNKKTAILSGSKVLAINIESINNISQYYVSGLKNSARQSKKRTYNWFSWFKLQNFRRYFGWYSQKMKLKLVDETLDAIINRDMHALQNISKQDHKALTSGKLGKTQFYNSAKQILFDYEASMRLNKLNVRSIPSFIRSIILNTLQSLGLALAPELQHAINKQNSAKKREYEASMRLNKLNVRSIPSFIRSIIFKHPQRIELLVSELQNYATNDQNATKKREYETFVVSDQASIRKPNYMIRSSSSLFSKRKDISPSQSHTDVVDAQEYESKLQVV